MSSPFNLIFLEKKNKKLQVKDNFYYRLNPNTCKTAKVHNGQNPKQSNLKIIILVLVPFRCNELTALSRSTPRLQSRPIVQGWIGGKSTASYVNLTVSEIEPLFIPRQEAEIFISRQFLKHLAKICYLAKHTFLHLVFQLLQTRSQSTWIF